ncbi:MAG: hypothetical protein C0614_07585 [Desulfuromonas sp.]|nr:MAG: hypothetical protein C0614_07585 [Desulfuromonas sp.]
MVSYGILAKKLGQPGASRAVGNAAGQNPVADLIPYHRVLRVSGKCRERRRSSPENCSPVTPECRCL